MRTRFHTLLLAIPVVLAVVLGSPAAAIQYGEPDNGAHPIVGGVVFEVDGAQIVGCSGTLIGPRTFLTAAHCYPDEVFQLVGITFADQFSPDEPNMVPLDNSAFIPYGGYDGTAYTDVAVIRLPYDPGVGYATLPEAGVLDTMAPSAQPGNQARNLTAVGYGTTGLNRGSGGPPEFVYPQIRMRAETRITNLNNANVGDALVQTTAAPGTGGGTCYGDSGGPFFIAGTWTIVAITITGYNPNCGGSDLNLRIDNPLVLDFISSVYV